MNKTILPNKFIRIVFLFYGIVKMLAFDFFAADGADLTQFFFTN